MASNQQTFRKKEIAKQKLQKRRAKQERREHRAENNDKGKPFEEMLAYIDEHGNISDTPPEKKYEYNENDLIKSDDEDVFSFGKVSYYNEGGQYGFIRNNETRESAYFNYKILGFELKQDQQVV